METALPEYDEAYYRDYDGQRYEHSEQWQALFRHFADRIRSSLAPRRTLDAGCAIGLLVAALHDLEIDAYGFDVSEFAVSQAPESVKDRVWNQSLTEPIKDRYDLITCIEVIEHLPASQAIDAVATLCAATDTILLSSTPEEHEEPTHLNVQPPEYWSALFAAHGFFRDTDYDATFISPWAVLYRRRPDDIAGVVRNYDRAWWRLRDENLRVRSALLKETDTREALGGLLSDAEWDRIRASDDQLAAIAEVAGEIRQDRVVGATSVTHALQAEVDDLRAQLSVQEERAVDAEMRFLVAKDEVLGAHARAGEMAARLVELEGETGAGVGLLQRYAELQAAHNAVLQSTSWRLTWKLMAPYRRHRARLAPFLGPIKRLIRRR